MTTDAREAAAMPVSRASHGEGGMIYNDKTTRPEGLLYV
jgi:hypothetical protein